MISVLIVDDSPTVSACLKGLFDSDPEFSVIGTACNGRDALRMVERLKPDIISMDFNMPDMNGFDATREIMSTVPTPIVIVSSIYNKHAAAMSFRSLEAGALAILPIPPAMNSPEFPQRRRELLQTFKTMAGVKLVRRTFAAAASEKGASVRQAASTPEASGREFRLIAIGASTGGPQVIFQILSRLSPEIPVPIVVVQHITPGFEHGFAAWLDQSTPFHVSVALDGEMLKGGAVYIAPHGVHMEVSREGRVVLIPGPAEHGVCPSVSRLFRSVAASFGNRAIGVILTGMGRDGADELKQLRDSGAETIAQDRESSVVHGMPGEAIKLGGACHVLSAEAISAMVNSLMKVKNS